MNGSVHTFTICKRATFILTSHFAFYRRKKVKPVWNDMRVIKWFQNFHFWVNYSFKLLVLLTLVEGISKACERFLAPSDMFSWGSFCRVRVVIVGMVSSLGGHGLSLSPLCPSADDMCFCCLSLFVLGCSSSEKGSSSTPVSTSLLCSLCMWAMSSALTRTPWLLSQLKYFKPLKVPLWFPLGASKATPAQNPLANAVKPLYFSTPGLELHTRTLSPIWKEDNGSEIFIYCIFRKWASVLRTVVFLCILT